MDGLWSVWWAWALAAVALAIFEIFAPGFILLGFAIGAGVVALLLAAGLPMAGSVPALLLLFSLFSLVAWFVLRRVTGVREGQVKIWDRDINED